MIVDSRSVPTSESLKHSNAVSLEFELEDVPNGATLTINDEAIITKAQAYAFARAKFLKDGYITQKVLMTVDFFDLQPGDIIRVQAPSRRVPKELHKDRFIVKQIEHLFLEGMIKTRIEAERYDP